MTKLYMTVGEYCSDVNTPSNVIGIFSTLALAIKAGVECHRAKYICSWYVNEIELDSVGVQEIVVTKETLNSTLKGDENV